MTTIATAANSMPISLGKTYKTLGLSALGGALEVFDFVIFIFLAEAIQHVFFPPDMPNWLSMLQTFAIFSAGYLARPLGGVIMALYADRFGRKKAFTISILMMSVPCFLISLMPGYQQIGYWAPLLLLLFRVIQGAAVGGEVPSAWVFVFEHTPKKYVGVILGALQAGLTLGYLLGAITGSIIFRVFTEDQLLSFAWRIPFFLGGICGVISVFMRLRLEETPVFIAMKKERSNEPPISLKQMLKEQRRSIFPAMLITIVLTSAVVALVVVAPTIMKQHYHISMQESLLISSIGIMALNMGCVLAGWVADKIGTWKAFYGYCFLMILGFFIFYCLLPFSFEWKLLGAVIAGFSCGVVAIVPSIMVQLFPTHSRVTGISVTYNLAYSLWAGITPPILISLAMFSTFSFVGYIIFAALLGMIVYKFMY